MQAVLEPAGRKKWSVAFLIVAECKEAVHGLRVQYVAEFYSD
jgi:hypothetical protein